MASVLSDFVAPNAPVLTLYLPRGRRDADLIFLMAELRRLSDELTGISGRCPTEAELHDAINLEDELNATASTLRAERNGVALSDRDFYALLRAREFLTPETWIAAAAAVPRGESPAKGTSLMMSGIVPEPMDIFDEIANMGARVVDDDLACLSRRIYPAINDPDPWHRMARALLGAAPEPTLGSPIPERVSHVRNKMQASGASGLLVYGIKFCEPELFYLPLLRAGLEEAGLQLLHVEFDLGPTLPVQTLTRIEAFVEKLRWYCH
jgi:benzoyl-CoA reductase/2-hydroxyglutaryl-CoA dehydratase subunit BcrC/BadD/HgdB